MIFPQPISYYFAIHKQVAVSMGMRWFFFIFYVNPFRIILQYAVKLRFRVVCDERFPDIYLCVAYFQR